MNKTLPRVVVSLVLFLAACASGQPESTVVPVNVLPPTVTPTALPLTAPPPPELATAIPATAVPATATAIPATAEAATATAVPSTDDAPAATARPNPAPPATPTTPPVRVINTPVPLPTPKPFDASLYGPTPTPAVGELITSEAANNPCPSWSLADVYGAPRGDWDGDKINNNDELYGNTNPCVVDEKG